MKPETISNYWILVWSALGALGALGAIIGLLLLVRFRCDHCGKFRKKIKARPLSIYSEGLMVRSCPSCYLSRQVEEWAGRQPGNWRNEHAD